MEENIKFRRSSRNIPVRKNIYIFSEGTETEPNYFESFKTLIESNPVYKKSISIQNFGNGVGTKTLFKAAKDRIKYLNIKYADVYLVFDKDDFSDFDLTIKNIENENLNSKYIKYHAIWSNESFEVWYLYHFEDFNLKCKRKDYLELLSIKLKFEYKKNSKDMFYKLIELGDPKKAILFAKSKIELSKDQIPSRIIPSTKVYELVSKLADYLPENIKQNFK